MNTDDMWAVYLWEHTTPSAYCASKDDADSVAEILECRCPDLYVVPPGQTLAQYKEEIAESDRQYKIKEAERRRQYDLSLLKK